MVISAAAREKIAAEIAKYPVPRGALLPALHVVHAEHGFVSGECARELAQIFGIRPFEVLEVVSFYNMFFSTPQPRHQVRVCTNLPCSLRGGRELLHRLEAHLSVGPDGRTADGRIRIGHEECLGACAYAPMMRVDSRYHEDLDVESAKRILDALD
jgi:NADH-quinone oxidoreductase subunit E